jgi:hypothetical protein
LFQDDDFENAWDAMAGLLDNQAEQCSGQCEIDLRDNGGEAKFQQFNDTCTNAGGLVVVSDCIDSYYDVHVKNNVDCFPPQDESQACDPNLYKYFVQLWLTDIGTWSAQTQCTITFPDGLHSETTPGLDSGPRLNDNGGISMNDSSAHSCMHQGNAFATRSMVATGVLYLLML